MEILFVCGPGGVDVLIDGRHLECLMKVNEGIQSSCLFASVLIVLFFRDARVWGPLRREIAAFGLVLPCAVVLLYAWSSGGISSFPAYVRNALEIAAGYSTFSRKYLKDSRRVFAYTRCVRRTDAELCSAGV